MYENKTIDAIKRDILRLKYSFPMRSIMYPHLIKNFVDIDKTFDMVWKQLKPYFIPKFFFGYNSSDCEISYGKDECTRIARGRELFEIDNGYEGYIKAIFKRFCIISAIDKCKEVAFDNQYVSVFHLAMLSKDLGYFAIAKNFISLKELLNCNSKAESYIDGLMKVKLRIENKKSQIVLEERYESDKKRSFKVAIEGDINRQASVIKDDNNRKLKNEGKKVDEKAKRFRTNNEILYSNRMICWENDVPQYVPFRLCDLSYLLINKYKTISTFETALNRILTGAKDPNSIEIVNCIKAHFSIVDLFNQHNGKASILTADGTNKEIDYDCVDTLLINNLIEKNYHIDLLYEILQLRRNIEHDPKFLFDASVYDNTLIKISKMPLAFARVLFAEYAINARNYDVFLEKVDESQLVNIYTKKYKRIANKKSQQLEWSDSFDRYVDHLSRIFIPLLEKVFICTLYAGKEQESHKNIMKYNSELLNILHEYASENIGSLTFDVLAEDSFSQNNIFNNWKYEDGKSCNNNISNIQKKVKGFDFSSLEKSELEFLKKFYKTVFTNDTYENDSNLFAMYDKLTLAGKGEYDIVSKDSDQGELLSDDYNKERAALDIKYMIDLIHMDK